MIGKIQPYQAPNVNQVAPKYRASRWALVQNVGDPFPGNPASNTFAFWFNYFWSEVKDYTGITTVQQQKAAEVFFQVFDDATGPAYTVRNDFAGRDSAYKENILRQLLLIGFKRVALDSPKMTVRSPGGRVIAPAPLVASDALSMNLKMVTGKRGKATPIAFRADGRSYEMLIEHKGFRTRARSEDSPIHAIYGLDQPWHPFSNPVYRNSMFLRLGSKNADNCLQTVISVGAEFAGITHFPILNDYVLVFQAKDTTGRPLALKPLTEWTPQDAAAALNHTQRVRVVRDASGEIDHLEKDNYIYAFLLDGVKLFNTEQYFKSHGHTPFPERGASEIPPENLLCEIHFVAKWFYSEAGGQIMLYELAFDPIRWLPSRSYIEVVIGESGVNELEAIILKEIAKARSRSDITGEKVVYDRQRRTRFSAAERQQVAQELSAFLKSPAAPKIPNAHKERTAVIQKLPAMAEKVNSLDVKAWNEFRAAAKLLP